MGDDALRQRVEQLGEYRDGRIGLPVLVRLRDLALELGDADSRGQEPPPVATVQAAEAEPGWWEQPYKGGPMVAVDGFPGPCYPPDAAADGKTPSVKSPFHKALKRTVCRLGRWNPWDPPAWDEAYSNLFAHGRGTGMVGDSGIAGCQRQQGIDDSGWVGEKTFNMLRSARVPTGSHQGEMAMDGPAVNMINEAYQASLAPPPGSLADVRAAIADYCLRSILAAAIWHYVQRRPMLHLGVPPDEDHPDDDCSEHATEAYYWARQQTGVAVPDPNGCGFNGYGYTGTLIANPPAAAPYQVGDLAIYGPSTSNTSHVVTCYLGGNAQTAEWCSNGSESAPVAVELHYRSDLLAVVRPPLTP